MRIKIGECPANQQQQQQTPDSASDLNGVNEFAFSPCGQYLAVVSQDGCLRVFSFGYEASQIHIQLRCSMKSYFGGLLCVCWSSDGRYLATGGEDDLITVFSFVDMRVACRGRGHSSWINAVAFDPWTVLPNYSTTNVFANNSGSSSSSGANAKLTNNHHGKSDSGRKVSTHTHIYFKTVKFQSIYRLFT